MRTSPASGPGSIRCEDGNFVGERWWGMWVVAGFLAVGLGVNGAPAPKFSLPEANQVQMEGPLGEAFARGVRRLSQAPYDSAAYLRSDISFEVDRVFVNYSGDISGRFIQIASLVSPPGRMEPATLPQVLERIGRYQRADGHFGREVDWAQPLERENPNAVHLPIFWGNSRLLVGLLEAYRAFGRQDGLEAARRIGDFYIATAGRFLDTEREAEYRMTGSYAAGYPTDYFPGMEGLALLYEVTKEERYLKQAERMADFFRKFDTLPIDHSHGNLVAHYGLLLLYESTGKTEYLDRALAKWKRAVDGGFVWPMGGVGEQFRVSFPRDEGCSEADWLRLNLRLWELTGEERFLEMAERLLWNHYAMNRTENGGYGHHEFISDEMGPVAIKPEFTEAVWCCTFHGLLGMHTFKRYAVAGGPGELRVNFPVSVSTVVEAGGKQCRVSLATTEPELGTLQCRVRVEDAGEAGELPKVLIRRPKWAESVWLDDGGQKLAMQEKGGYVQLPAKSGGEWKVAFKGGLRLEDRRLKPLTMDSVRAEHAGVTLWMGPHLMFGALEAGKPLRVTLAPGGKLVFPEGGRFTLAGPEGNKAADTTALSPWTTSWAKTGARFVWDVVAESESSKSR